MSGKYDDLVTAAKLITLREYASRNQWNLKQSGANLIGPCPKPGCGGTDRFGINTKQNKWNCRTCDKGGHDAISLAMHVENLEFIAACEFLTGQERTAVIDPALAEKQRQDLIKKEQQRQRDTNLYREKARWQAYSIWKRRKPAGKIIQAYLDCRNIKADVSELGAALGEFASLEYWHKPRNQRGSVIHAGPAMVAVIQFGSHFDGRFAGVHRTWLDASQPKGKAVIMSGDGLEQLDSRLTRGTKGNGAIRLVTPESPTRLVMGEGIETTGSAFAHERDPATAYWAGIDKGHMAGRAMYSSDGKRLLEQPDMDDKQCFIVPEWCNELIYLLDVESDEKQAEKTRMAMIRGLRRQMRIRPGLIARLGDPGMVGDFNDFDLKISSEL